MLKLKTKDSICPQYWACTVTCCWLPWWKVPWSFLPRDSTSSTCLVHSTAFLVCLHSHMSVLDSSSVKHHTPMLASPNANILCSSNPVIVYPSTASHHDGLKTRCERPPKDMSNDIYSLYSYLWLKSRRGCFMFVPYWTSVSSPSKCISTPRQRRSWYFWNFHSSHTSSDCS